MINFKVNVFIFIEKKLIIIKIKLFKIINLAIMYNKIIITVSFKLNILIED
jgi:hypothetical protein